MSDQEQYKEEFLQTANQFRQTRDLEFQRTSQLANSSQLQNTQKKSHIGQLTKITNTNDIWSSNQYSDAQIFNIMFNNQDLWRKKMQTSFYNKEHNQKYDKQEIRKKNQFTDNELLNPEIHRGDNNMRVTRISEYSNALHNNRVNQILVELILILNSLILYNQKRFLLILNLLVAETN